MSVTLIREAIDDIRRWQRDREVNNSRWYKDLALPAVAISWLSSGPLLSGIQLKTCVADTDTNSGSEEKFYGSESGSSPNFDTDPGKNDTIPDPDLKDSVPGSLRKILKI